jgi:hypothetical protein
MTLIVLQVSHKPIGSGVHCSLHYHLVGVICVQRYCALITLGMSEKLYVA